KIYVANYGKFCIIRDSCNQAGSITIIDGATNSTSGLGIPSPNLPHPVGLAVNTNTNSIYVANQYSTEVHVIDGSTYAVTTIFTPTQPYDIAANLATDRIYVSNFSAISAGSSQTVTAIDGVTDGTTLINDPKAADPIAIAVNPVTNKIYVANLGN